MVLSSFDQENHDRILKEAYEKKGEEKILRSLVKKKLEKGISIADIAEMLEQDEKTISQIVEKIHTNSPG